MSQTLRTSTRPTNCTSRACNTTSGVEGGHNRYRCRTRVRANASRRSHTKSTKFRSFTHRCKGAMYSGTIVPHMNSSRHRAAALRAHRCTARSPQRAPFLFQPLACWDRSVVDHSRSVGVLLEGSSGAQSRERSLIKASTRSLRFAAGM